MASTTFTVRGIKIRTAATRRFAIVAVRPEAITKMVRDIWTGEEAPKTFAAEARVVKRSDSYDTAHKMRAKIASGFIGSGTHVVVVDTLTGEEVCMGLLSPRQFPSLATPREKLGGRGFHVCNVCGLAVEPRNGRAHRIACARRKGQDPALWHLWKMEMHGATVQRIRSAMWKGFLPQLAQRQMIVQGPLDRRGRFSGER